jgi:glucose/mannose transport system substrate-binding protein
MQFTGDRAKGALSVRGYTADKDFGCSLVPGTASREEAAEGQKAFARMVLDRDNQVPSAVSRARSRTDDDPSGVDRCGRLGLQMIAEKKGEVSAQSMPTQLSDGWIDVLADFFNHLTITSETAQRRLHDVVMQR